MAACHATRRAGCDAPTGTHARKRKGRTLAAAVSVFVAVSMAAAPAMTLTGCSGCSATPSGTPESRAADDQTSGTDDIISGDERQSLRDILSNGTDASSPSLDLSEADREEAERQLMRRAMRAYVAPSPYEEDALLCGNEPTPEGTQVAATEHDIELPDAHASVRGTVAYAELSRAISELEGQGYEVGISLLDLTGNELLSYDAGNPLYPASAIKGPYVISLWRDGSPSSSLRWRTESIFGWSDNDAYHALQDVYGASPLRSLAQECDLDLSWYGGSAWSWAQWYYPRTSARDMSRMWVACSGYVLDMSSDDAEELRGYILDREVSPLRDGLTEYATTYGKAGWISEGGDYGATPAAVDAGLAMWPDGRAYVLTVMTDTEENMGAVAGLVACVDRCHYAMTNPLADATASQVPASVEDALAIGALADTVPAEGTTGVQAPGGMAPAATDTTAQAGTVPADAGTTASTGDAPHATDATDASPQAEAIAVAGTPPQGMPDGTTQADQDDLVTLLAIPMVLRPMQAHPMVVGLPQAW